MIFLRKLITIERKRVRVECRRVQKLIRHGDERGQKNADLNSFRSLLSRILR
jgi:hypothetical protein